MLIPKEFKDAKWLSALSYSEVIEMAYYGAQVIHPKTIKPLQNKQIPLICKVVYRPLASRNFDQPQKWKRPSAHKGG